MGEKAVRDWLKDTAKLGQYAEAFIAAGYDDLGVILNLKEYDRFQRLVAAIRMKEGHAEKLLQILNIPTKDSIVLKGLPQLGQRTSSKTPPSENQLHDPAESEEKPFGIVDPLPLKATDSPIWGLKKIDPRFDYVNEDQIQQRVTMVLQEVIASLSLEMELSAVPELSVFKLRADIWIITTKTGNPIGVIEVKLPGKDIMKSKKLHGQTFDYMTRLQSFHGLTNVFGLATTYEQWQVYWLPQCSTAAAATSVGVRPAPPPLEDIDDSDEPANVEPPTEDKRPDRILQCSKIYDWNHPDLVKVLASVILKMYTSKCEPVKRIDPNRPYIRMDESRWIWTTYKFRGFKLNYHAMPLITARTFILLEDLRGGRDGRVWLVCTENGRVGVIKFAQVASSDIDTPEFRKQRLEEEAKMWKKVNAEHPLAKFTRVIKLGGDWALLMPYLKLVPSKDSAEVRAATKTAVESMGNKGLLHPDLDWRHVGTMSPQKKGDKPKSFLFDFAGVKPMDSAKATTAMLQQLQL